MPQHKMKKFMRSKLTIYKNIFIEMNGEKRKERECERKRERAKIS